MNGCTGSDERIASSGSLAFDLLEHEATLETLLAYHGAISAALARFPSTELWLLFDDTLTRLAACFAAMERVLDAHAERATPCQRATLDGWRAAILRLKARYEVEHTITANRTRTVTPQRVRVAA